MAPWFHGTLDESAYYDYALSGHRIGDRHKIGKAKDEKSLEAGLSDFNTEGPFTDPGAPKNNGVYAPGKVPDANFSCSDPDDVGPVPGPADSDIALCEATVDGNPIINGEPLPDTLGDHLFQVIAIDEGGNHYHHTHKYTVKNFDDLFRHDSPIAYYRLDDGLGATTMADSSANGHDGEYKNDQDSGPTGISGDGNHARDFFGLGGYGYVNGITAPTTQSTLEAWVKPLGDLDSSSSEFNDSSVPGGWNTHIWNPGGSVTVGGGSATIDGARLGTDSFYGSGRTLDFAATFEAGSSFTHGGFGADYNSAPWAMFSVKGDGHLYARTDNGNPGGSLESHLGTGYLGSEHRYRVEWTANKVDFYVDGDIVASHTVSFGPTQMRPLFSDFNSAGPALHLNWVRMSPHSHRDQSIAGHGDAGELYIRGGYFHFRHMDKTVTSSVAVKPGQWQQVVGTWDGVDIKIWVDGVLAGTVEQTKRPSSSSTFYVGYGELAPWFRGSIDEVAYYGTALTSARVFQHFLADPPPAESGDAGGPGDADDQRRPSTPSTRRIPSIPRIRSIPRIPSIPRSIPRIPDPPVDPVDPTDPPVDPVDPDDPDVETNAACKAAVAALDRAEKKLAKANKAKRKAKKSGSAKKLKKAKKAVDRARFAVAKAQAAGADNC